MSIEKRLQKLLNIESNTESIISFYFNLDPGQRENRKYKTELKNLIKKYQSVLDSKDLSESSRELINKKFKDIENFINDDNKINGFRAIALFTSLNTKMWEVFNLPVIKRNRIILDRYAHVSELLNLLSYYGKIATLLIDQTKARLFISTLDGTNEMPGFLYPGATRTKRFQSPKGKFKQRVSPSTGKGMISQGFGEYAFNRSIENELHQHFKYVSDNIFEYYKTNKFDRLIIGGDSQLVQEFSHHLHSYLNSTILGYVNVDVDNFSPDDFLNLSSPFIEDMILSNQEKLLQNFNEKLGIGYAVNGIESVITALYNGQIKTIIGSEGYMRDGFICPECLIISVNKENHKCPALKEPVYFTDIVDQLIEQSIRMGSELEIIKKEKLKDKIDGIGAILRYVL
jgi:peptide subunit release factor 1 (eRF1)